MTHAASKLTGGVLLVGAAVLLVGLSAVPYQASNGAQGVLRLSWRYRMVATQECRTRTPEELNALPVHMRSPEVCERGLPDYRLSVRVDGVGRIEEVVHPAGAAGDRPLYVHRELEVSPGEHRIEVVFAPLTAGEAEDEGLGLDRSVTIPSGGVVLVTYDPNTGQLEVIESRGDG